MLAARFVRTKKNLTVLAVNTSRFAHKTNAVAAAKSFFGPGLSCTSSVYSRTHHVEKEQQKKNFLYPYLCTAFIIIKKYIEIVQPVRRRKITSGCYSSGNLSAIQK